MVTGNSQDQESGLDVPVLNLEGEVDLGQAQLSEVGKYLFPNEVGDLLLCELLLHIALDEFAQQVPVLEPNHYTTKGSPKV